MAQHIPNDKKNGRQFHRTSVASPVLGHGQVAIGGLSTCPRNYTARFGVWHSCRLAVNKRFLWVRLYRGLLQTVAHTESRCIVVHLRHLRHRQKGLQMLSFQTITPDTLELLKQIFRQPELAHMRLVGGTALALQYGHRRSIDLGDLRSDFFTL